MTKAIPRRWHTELLIIPSPSLFSPPEFSPNHQRERQSQHPSQPSGHATLRKKMATTIRLNTTKICISADGVHWNRPMFFHVMFLRKNQAWVCLVFSSHLFPQIERTGLILSSDDKQAYFTLLLALECHPPLPNTAFPGGGVSNWRTNVCVPALAA